MRYSKSYHKARAPSVCSEKMYMRFGDYQCFPVYIYRALSIFMMYMPRERESIFAVYNADKNNHSILRDFTIPYIQSDVKVTSQVDNNKVI